MTPAPAAESSTLRGMSRLSTAIPSPTSAAARAPTAAMESPRAVAAAELETTAEEETSFARAERIASMQRAIGNGRLAAELEQEALEEEQGFAGPMPTGLSPAGLPPATGPLQPAELGPPAQAEPIVKAGSMTPPPPQQMAPAAEAGPVEGAPPEIAQVVTAEAPAEEEAPTDLVTGTEMSAEGAPAAEGGEAEAVEGEPVEGMEAAEAEGGGGGEVGAAGGEGGAVGAAGGGGGGGVGTAAVDLIMPEPPTEMSGAEVSRIEAVGSRAGGAVAATTELPTAGENVTGARGAVDEPQEETTGRAEAGLVAALDERPAPSPTIEELCADIKRVIKSKRPPDEESLVEANPEEMAKEAQGQFDENVQGDVNRVGGEYDSLQGEPGGQPAQVGQAIEPTPESVDTPDPRATQATPDAVAAENVSLDADVEATQARMDDAGMTTEPAQLVETGPVAEARGTMGELEKTAEEDPAQVLAAQQESLAEASAGMAELQQQALTALASARSRIVNATAGRQDQMVGTEGVTRESVSAEARTIFREAQQAVETLLRPLPQTAMEKWEKGSQVLATKFKQRLREVEKWIEERHSGVWGAIVGAWDYLTGLPGWVVREYDAAEEEFGHGVCDLVREISTEVNSVVAACETIIEDARGRISELFANLPEDLAEWAAAEQEKFNADLNGLHNQAINTRDEFNKQIISQARQAVQSAREEIHELRKKAGGLIGAVLDAVNRFLDDPAKFIIEGLLHILGIPPASFWALVAKIQQVISDIADDPLGFASNLLSAVGQGFQRFFDNIAGHLLDGLLEWLFSGLGSVGVTIPKDFSLKSIITFFLELMGITWARIRELLAKHLGEENVALIEKAYEIISTLIELGPEGIFEMIKEKLDPRSLLDMVLKAAVDYLVQALIKAVAARIIMLFNPVGAILQAIEAIYRVLKWIVQNAARIFRLVETVVNGIADIIAGNIGGMAAAIETALASLISPVIDFLADYLGFGDLPEKIAETIAGFQEWVYGILDKVIGFLADKARALVAALGFGGEEEAPEENRPSGYDGEIGESVPFSVEGEDHTLFIVTNGEDSEVMISSAPMTLSALLDDWTTKADAVGNAKKRKEVHDLIAQARQEDTALNAKADELAAIADDDPRDESKVEKLDQQVEKAEARLVATLKSIRKKLGLGGKLVQGTADNPIPLDWPKHEAEEYPVLYYYPKKGSAKEIITQEAALGSRKPTEEYHPTEQSTLPDGNQIGIAAPYQVHVGMTFEMKSSAGTGGGGKINARLAKFGYSASAEGMDGDHVLERQVGGPDNLANLWPLDKSENRSSGSTLKSATFPQPNGEVVTMADVKEEVKDGNGVWFKIQSTL